MFNRPLASALFDTLLELEPRLLHSRKLKITRATDSAFHVSVHETGSTKTFFKTRLRASSPQETLAQLTDLEAELKSASLI